MEIKVCIGSACHLKGSYTIISRLMEMIEDRGLNDRVEVKGVFCLGHCVDAVSVQVDNQICSVSVAGVEEFFNKYVQIAEN